jgi:hypothetical protein
MANNQFLTVADVYNPLETEMKLQAIQEGKLRNRIEAMKMRELYQQQARRDKWRSAADDPRGLFNPVSGQFALQGGAPIGQTQTAQPMPQQQVESMPTPTPTPPQPPQLSDEDRAAIRGQKKLMAMTQQAQPLITQAKNDPSARQRIIKLVETLDKDTDHQALVKRAGFDEMKYNMDPETGEGSYSLAKNWTAEELEQYAENAPNGQVLAPLAKHPGKYRIEFNDEGAVTGFYTYSKEEAKNLKSLTTSQLVDKSLHDPDPRERHKAKEILQGLAEYKKESSPLMGEFEMSDDTLDALAERFDITGMMPPLGMGRKAAQARGEILNRWGNKLKEQGKTAADQVLSQATYKSNQSALTDLTKREQLLGTFVNRIDVTSDLVMDFAKEVGNKSERLLNIPRNKIAKIMGSGTYRAFELALFSLSAEIGKVETGQLGISAVTDTQLKIMNAIHDPNLSIAELQKLINGGKALGSTSMKSIRQQRERLRKEIGSGSSQYVSPKKIAPEIITKPAAVKKT